MKSKYNPLIFRSLATGAALFAITPLHAADVDTTGTTVTVSPGNKYIGNGTLQVSGGGEVWLGYSDVAPITQFAMTGGLIDIVSGTTLMNGGWQKLEWYANKAGLQVNGGFQMTDGQWVFADALTGSGAVTMNVDYAYGWMNHLTVGVNGGGGTFTGTISDSGSDDTVRLTKTGGGTQILTGTNTYRDSTNVNGGKLTVSSTGTINSTSGVSIGAGEFNYNSSTALTQAVSFSGTGGTLSGSGTINQAVSITTGNTLAIGNSVGQMNFGSTLNLAGTTVMEIDGTVGAGLAGGHDFANVTGALTYGGALTLDLGTIFGTGTYSWNLFDFAAADLGTFSTITLADQYSGSLLDGDSNGIWDLNSGNNTWQFTESTGVLGLTVIPEPNVAALLGGLGVVALLRRRR
jgi:autotransporter-associated beta strand protein